MSAKTQTIDSWLKTHAAHQPDRIALSYEGTDWRYTDLSDWVERMAAVLSHELGLKRGDRLAYLGKNSDIQVALMFAAARLGVMFVPLNWRLEAAELNHMLSDCTPKLVIYAPDFVGILPGVMDDLDATAMSTEALLTQNATAPVISEARLDDPFLIVYTSGTTGRPKGAVITQKAVLWNAIISVHAHDFTNQDHTLNLLPLFHVGGINIQMMPSFFVGARVTLHAMFDPDQAIAALANAGITSTVCVPTVMNALLAHPQWQNRKFPALRLINTGSTDVPVEILKAVNDRGIPMVQVYGTTETGPIATYQKASEAVATMGSIGRCGAHTQVRVVREDGNLCEIGEPGEIEVKGPNNFSHYFNDMDATKAALVDGWFRTGDIAYRDENGLFWFSGRSKHVIISGGENIYPAELERILNGLDDVLECAVVGRDDERWGQVPVAVVVPRAHAPDKALILNAFDQRIARFKRPKDVVFVEALPKNALGKILVEKVRDMVNEWPLS